MSPTARAKSYCKKRGWPCGVVEKWNSFAKIRQDLFGIIDVVVLAGDQMIGVQATSRSNHKARVEKVLASPMLEPWLRTGVLVQVWSFDPKILKTIKSRRFKVSCMAPDKVYNEYEELI